MTLPTAFVEDQPGGGYYPARDSLAFAALDWPYHPYDRVYFREASAAVQAQLQGVIADYRHLTSTGPIDNRYTVSFAGTLGGRPGQGTIVLRQFEREMCAVTLFLVAGATLPLEATRDALVQSLRVVPTTAVQPSPTALPPTPIPAPPPTPVPTVPQAVAFASGGLGLSFAEWERRHGRGNKGRYENDDYLVSFTSGDKISFTEGNIYNIIRQYSGPRDIPLSAARTVARGLIPADAQFLRTYNYRDGVADVYMSESLKSRFPPGRNVAWGRVEEGAFVVRYGISTLAETRGLVYSIEVGTGYATIGE